MDVAKVSQIVVIMLSPTLAIGTAIYLHRAIRALLRRRNRDAGPGRPPIEDLAADLRRLLRRYEALKRTPDVPARSVRLLALEGAITDCAVQAARALELPSPDRPAHGGLATPDLGRLLRALADAGLVLSPATGLLSPDPP